MNREQGNKWIARMKGAITQNKTPEQLEQARAVLERMTSDPRFAVPSPETNQFRQFQRGDRHVQIN